ncbi:hypothetical protein BSKO_00068 [Bryopsis sp. KO-2023]|nr:hypothetical protein BSKO_00068 [Bryopsis sp. KO-2023]
MDFFVPDQVEAQLKNFNAVIGDIESKLRPLTSENALAGIEKLPSLERAQAFMLIASSACRLYELYLKAHGQNPILKEKFIKEKKRVAQFELRVQKAVTDHELATTKRSAVVNVAAANRFIDNALPDLSKDQKAALRQVPKEGRLQKPAVPVAAPQSNKPKKRKQELVEIDFLREMLEDVKKAACDPQTLSGKTEEKGSGQSGEAAKKVDGGAAEGEFPGADATAGCGKGAGGVTGCDGEAASVQEVDCQEEEEVPCELNQGLLEAGKEGKREGSGSRGKSKQVREKKAGQVTFNKKRKTAKQMIKAKKKRKH